VQEKQIRNIEGREREIRIGNLVVLTGRSGSGKDAVMDALLANLEIEKLGIKRVVTCTDRPPRTNTNPPEVDGLTYHFVTPEELVRMEKNGELVEPRTNTGTCFKATPKFEIERLLTGEDLIWRIDPSRAAEVATGEFFDKVFPKHSEILKNHTLTICIVASTETIESWRKGRDKDKYNPKEYEERDTQELPHLKTLHKYACVVENFDGKLDHTVAESLTLIQGHHAKIKNE
jgi:guanylate kinase